MYKKKTKTQKEIVTQQKDQTHLPTRGECIKTKEKKKRHTETPNLVVSPKGARCQDRLVDCPPIVM